MMAASTVGVTVTVESVAGGATRGSDTCAAGTVGRAATADSRASRTCARDTDAVGADEPDSAEVVREESSDDNAAMHARRESAGPVGGGELQAAAGDGAGVGDTGRSEGDHRHGARRAIGRQGFRAERPWPSIRLRRGSPAAYPRRGRG